MRERCDRSVLKYTKKKRQCASSGEKGRKWLASKGAKRSRSDTVAAKTERNSRKMARTSKD